MEILHFNKFGETPSIYYSSERIIIEKSLKNEKFEILPLNIIKMISHIHTFRKIKINKKKTEGLFLIYISIVHTIIMTKNKHFF